MAERSHAEILGELITAAKEARSADKNEGLRTELSHLRSKPAPAPAPAKAAPAFGARWEAPLGMLNGRMVRE